MERRVSKAIGIWQTIFTAGVSVRAKFKEVNGKSENVEDQRVSTK